MTANIIEAAVQYIEQSSGPAPVPADVVAALLSAEKQSKRAKQRYVYEQFLGSWRLGFVSGTQTKRLRPAAKPIKTVGKGRFLPRFVTIAITYRASESIPSESSPNEPLGSVCNSVALSGLQLQLTGPTRYWPKTNSLGFDFTHVKVGLGPLTIYDGSMRGGKQRDHTFKTQGLKDQAFFTFFCVEKNYIAARGKGGGLALWVRQSEG